jgi:hypothetical protein
LILEAEETYALDRQGYLEALRKGPVTDVAEVSDFAVPDAD